MMAFDGVNSPGLRMRSYMKFTWLDISLRPMNHVSNRHFRTGVNQPSAPSVSESGPDVPTRSSGERMCVPGVISARVSPVQPAPRPRDREGGGLL